MQKKSSHSVKIYYPKYSPEEVIKEFKNTIHMLLNKLSIEKAILFGSYAKKRYTVASDIDILIVFDETKYSENEVYKILRKNIRIPGIELHILTKTDYIKARESKWIKTIEKEGIKII